MRITIVQGPFLPVPPLRGGAIEKAWFALGGEFARCGHEVTHISRRFAGLPDAEVINVVRHRRVDGYDTPSSLRLGGIDVLWPRRLLRDRTYARRALRVLPEADILITNSVSLPTMVTGADEHGRLFVHVGRFPKAQVGLYRHAARLHAPSGAVAEALRRRIPNAGAQICAIPYPLSSEMRLATAQDFDQSWSRRAKRIVFAGRIHPQKGLDLLVDAFAQLAATKELCDWRLSMIGPIEESMGGAGPAYRDSLIRRAGAAASSIDWIGLIAEPHLLASHLQSAAIFVYPSIDESGETFGVAALEALACGCPTIVSDLRCFGDYLIPGNTGFRFSHRSTAAAQELRSLLVRLIADDELRRSCAKRGWEATERFLLPQIAGEFVREFEIMIQDR